MEQLKFRETKEVQSLLNHPRVLSANSFRSFFDGIRKAGKDLNLEETAKTIISKGDAGYQVHVSLVDEEPGYNPRDYTTPEVAASIKVLSDRYLNSLFVEDMTAIVRDGKVLVREGHTRRRGLRKALEFGAPIQRVSLRPFSGGRDEEDLIPITSNSGNGLRPLETAVVLERQVTRHGKTHQEVANAIGRTVPHVRNMLKLLEMPENMQSLVKMDQIAPDYALELVKEHGAQAYDVAMTSMRDTPQPTNGPKKQKVTRKSVNRGTPQAISLNKANKTRLWESVTSVVGRLPEMSDDNGDCINITLPRSTVEELMALHADMQKQINSEK